MYERLAQQIRHEINLLIGRYDAQLRMIPGYAELSEPARHNLEQRVLELVADCLEMNNDQPLIDYVRERAEQVLIAGFKPEWFQQAVAVPEGIVAPLTQTVEESNFVWRTLNRAQQMVWQLVAAERQQAERSLRESDARFRSLFEKSADAYLLIADGLFIDCNEATVHMMHARTKEEFLAVHPSRLSPEYQPDGRPSDEKADEMMQLALTTGSHRFEWVHRRMDGEDFPVEVLLTPIQVSGQPMIFTVWRDISQRKHAEAQVQRNLQETQLRLAISRALASAQSSEEVLDTLIQQISVYPQAHVSLFTLAQQADDIIITLRRDELFDSGMTGTMPVGTQLPVSRFTLGHHIMTQQPFISDDFLADNRIEYASREMGRLSGTASLVAYPLSVGSESLGVLVATSKTVAYFDEDKQHLYRTLAEQGAVALQTARLRDEIHESLARRSSQVQVSTQVAQEIAAATDLDELFHRVVTLIKERFNYYHAQIFQSEANLDTVVLVTGYGEAGKRMLAARHKLRLGRGVVGVAAATGRPILAADVSQDKDWQPNPNLPETRSELAVPIKLRDQVLGILDVQSDRVGALTAEDQLLLEGLCGQIAIAIEHRQAEDRLAEERNFIRALIDSLPDLIYAKDRESRFILANTATAQRMGTASPQDLIGKSDLDFYPPDLARQYLASEQPIIREGQPSLDIEERTVDPAGRPRWNLSTKVPRRNQHGEIIGLIGTTRDITERKEVEEALRRSEAELSTALQIAKLGYWEYDVAKDEFLFNDQFYAIFHTTAEREGGYRLSSAQYAQRFVYSEDLPVVGVEIEKALTSTDRRYRRQLEHRIRYADGGTGYISVSINIERNAQGDIERYYGANQDITERKHSEAEREQLLREQERRALQLQTASEISRAASSILNLDLLLPQAVELIRTRFNLYYVGIFLTDEAEDQAILKAGTGEAGQHMLANGHKLEIGGNSMISQCILNEEARIALDVGEEAVRFDNPALPLTRSEMALPLLSRGQIIGAMTIQSDRPAAFAVDDITVLQSMADQIATAVENARLYDQAQAALADTDRLLQASAELNVAENYDDVLAVIRKHSTLGKAALTVAINVFDHPWTDSQTPQWIELIGYNTRRQTGMEIGTRFPLAVFASARTLLRADASTVLEDLNDPAVDANTRALFMQRLGSHSVIFVPLLVGGQWVGYINVLFAQTTHFDEADVRQLETLVSQAAVALQNMRNLAGVRQALTETEASYRATQAIGRAQSVESILEAATPVVQLLGMTRLTLRLVTRRDLKGLSVANDIYAYHWLEQQWVLQACLKDAPVGDSEALRRLQRNPEEVLLYPDALDSTRAMPAEVRQALVAEALRSSVMTGINLREEVLGFLEFNSPLTLTDTAEQRIRLTIRTLSDQMAVALQNRRLLEQSRAALEEVDAINRRLTGEAWDSYLHQQAGREVIWVADDVTAAPGTLQLLDEQLTAGEIRLEPDPEDASMATVTAPILLRGQSIGALRLRTPLSEWNEDIEAVLADLTNHIAQAVENARLIEQTQRTASRERAINEINARVRQSVDLDAILRTAVNELGQSLKAARVVARVGTLTPEGVPAPEGTPAPTGNGRGKMND